MKGVLVFYRKNFKVHWRNINKNLNKKTGMPLWKTLTVIKMSISLKLSTDSVQFQPTS